MASLLDELGLKRARLAKSNQFAILSFFLCSGTLAPAASTLTLQTNKLGPTPDVLAYNCGHFVPGSNTRDWWRYSGTTGARLFITASVIEPNDDIAGRGDGVTNQTSFVTRRTALRANPLSTTYINWPYLTNNYGVVAQHGANTLSVNYAASELRRIGVQLLICVTASENTFSITDTNDWAGKWELWQHYYAEAFYLGREFDAQRYQMYNEPNLASSLTQAEFLERLQLASDAIQCAIADVNALYGKALLPLIESPVTGGTASSTYASWGKLVVTNRHLNYLGQTDANFQLVHRYDYHEYNSSPASFGNNLASLNTSLTADLAPEARWPTSISEFNVHTAAMFDTLTETLDSPSKYARFGSIVVNLTSNLCAELYCFKFSQTLNTTSVKKNGMHFVDNTNAPYNIGGVTKAGEVWRLFNKAAASGRDRLNMTRGTGGSVLDVEATSDPAAGRYYVFSSNQSTNVALTLDVTAWHLAAGQRALIEEVSENYWGGVRSLVGVTKNQIVAGTQGSNTVLLLTMPTQPQDPPQTIIATEDAMVQDGANRGIKYGSNTVCWVRNNSTNASVRSAAFLKFHLPQFYAPDLQFALLTVRASALNGSAAVQAHLYGITNSTWSQSSIAWSNAPNLKQNVAPGSDYTNNFVLGAGDSAQMLGQLVAGSSPADRLLDVTSFVRSLSGTDASFLLAREVRFYGDKQDDDGLALTTQEADPINGPRLVLVYSSVARPRLSISRSGGNVVISWPTNSAGFGLQTALSLASPVNWLDLTNAVVSGTNYTLTVSPAPASCFYRLAR